MRAGRRHNRPWRVMVWMCSSFRMMCSWKKEKFGGMTAVWVRPCV